MFKTNLEINNEEVVVYYNTELKILVNDSKYTDEFILKMCKEQLKDIVVEKLKKEKLIFV